MYSPTLRRLLASRGLRFPNGVGKYARRVTAVAAERPGLVCVMETMLSDREALMESIAALDREVAHRAQWRLDCRLLMWMPHMKSLTELHTARQSTSHAR